MLNEDFRLMPKLLDMDFSCRDGLCAMSRTRRALSRELDRLRLGAWWPLVAFDVDDCAAYRVAAASAWGDAVGEAL